MRRGFVHSANLLRRTAGPYIGSLASNSRVSASGLLMTWKRRKSGNLAPSHFGQERTSACQWSFLRLYRGVRALTLMHRRSGSCQLFRSPCSRFSRVKDGHQELRHSRPCVEFCRRLNFLAHFSVRRVRFIHRTALSSRIGSSGYGRGRVVAEPAAGAV
jgi:hypothetical protein